MMQFHEVATIFPMMSDDDYAALRDDIKTNGLRQPITTWRGKIVDGRNRYKACKELGIVPHTVEWDGRGSLVQYVVSLNLSRRHLTASQKAAVAVDMLPMLEEEAKSRQGKRTDLTSVKELTQVSEPQRATEHAAHLVGTNRQYVSDAKRLHSEAPAMFEKVRSGEMTIPEAKREVRKEKQRDQMAEIAKAAPVAKSEMVQHGDFRALMKSLDDNSVDLIFTDPPYDEESISMYGDMAALAARKLRTGGSLICYAGHYAVPRISRLMDEHLRYWWLIALQHGGGSARLMGKCVFVEWKPLLWYVKEKRWNQEYVADMFKSEPSSKANHEWEQSTTEASYYIDKLTVPGSLVVDPFCGSGTTGVAALKMGRRFIGYEVDAARYAVAVGRIESCKQQ